MNIIDKIKKYANYRKRQNEYIKLLAESIKDDETPNNYISNIIKDRIELSEMKGTPLKVLELNEFEFNLLCYEVLKQSVSWNGKVIDDLDRKIIHINLKLKNDEMLRYMGYPVKVVI